MAAQEQMAIMNAEQLAVLEEVAGLRGFPAAGAFNIRLNGGSIGRENSNNIAITPRADGSGIEIRVAPGTLGETVHIPVILSRSGLHDVVQNEFFIGEFADVTIIAGCGIHNDGNERSRHDGVHVFHVGQGARLRYEEKHYGAGAGTGGRVLNPVTELYLGEGSHVEMDTVQIAGVDDTDRKTRAKLECGASLVVREKLLTDGAQTATTEFQVELAGEGSSANVISRSVAKGGSRQLFLSKIDGNAPCAGHSECDAIIMDSASVRAVPEITANHTDAALIHEAAIGKIAGDQIIKLMTLGLTEEEAEARIVEGFLR